MNKTTEIIRTPRLHWTQQQHTLVLSYGKLWRQATDCGIHRLVAMVLHFISKFEHKGWMLMCMHGECSNAYGTTVIVMLWGFPKSNLAAACWGQVAKVSAYHSKLWWFESVSGQSVQCCTTVWWSGCVGQVTTQKMKRENKERRQKTATNRWNILFCVHLAAIVNTNDWPALVEQSCWKIHHSRDGTIFKWFANNYWQKWRLINTKM
jgi:hypothetical protein